MGMIDKLFGGGQKKAGKTIAKGYEQAAQFQEPYYEGGQNAFRKLQTGYDKMENPLDFYNTLSEGYEPSKGFNFQLQKIMDIINNNNIKTGRFGTTAGNEAVADYTHDLLGTDFQTFIQNLLGINQQYLGGENSLATMGQNAANNLSQFKIGQAGGKAQSQIGDAMGWKGLMTTILNTAANAYTGGLSGVIAPYSSTGQADLQGRASAPRLQWGGS